VNVYSVVKPSVSSNGGVVLWLSTRSCRFRARQVQLEEETKSCGGSFVLTVAKSFSALLKFSPNQAKFLLSICVNV